MKKLFCLFTVFGIACSGDSLYRDVQGVIKSGSPASLSIPASPTPTITILGRDADEFTVEFITNTLGTSSANFIIHDVPQKQPLIFQITHPSFDPVISFPYDLKITPAITLPALAAGTTAEILTNVETLSGQTISSTAGMILGQLASDGSASGGCGSINSVAIKNKETNGNVSVVGPFYFNSAGDVVNTGHFSDSQCNYVMANVLPGTYILEFLDSQVAVQSRHEVIVLSGNVSFGLDVQ
jgi:hypothetical protein